MLATLDRLLGHPRITAARSTGVSVTRPSPWLRSVARRPGPDPTGADAPFPGVRGPADEGYVAKKTPPQPHQPKPRAPKQETRSMERRLSSLRGAVNFACTI